MSPESPLTPSVPAPEANAAPAPAPSARLKPPSGLDTLGTYCLKCGLLVHFDQQICPGCGQQIDHRPSKVQRYGLLGGAGFIALGGLCIFFQPRAYHTIPQDFFELLIISCVIGAGICFFLAVADMIRRGE
jgi:hypothetical protein